MTSGAIASHRDFSRSGSGNPSISIGVLLSLIFHALFVLYIQYEEGQRSSKDFEPQIFTVTIDAGERLGGFGQVPKDEGKKPKVLPVNEPNNEVTPKPLEKVAEPEKPVSKDVEKVVPEKPLESPSVIEEKKLEEKKVEEEKKKLEEIKLKVQEKEEKEAKERLEETKLEEKKLEEKKKEYQEKKNRDQALKNAIQAAKNRYTGLWPVSP